MGHINNYKKNILYSEPLIICHRKNTIKQLVATPTKYGVEIDVRSFNNEIILNRVKSIVNSKFNFVYFKQINSIIYQSFDKFDTIWGWKDPRNTFTLNIWAQIFDSFKIINS